MERIELIALLFCLLAGLLPIWLVERFPSVDGPMHLYIVYIIDQLAQPGTNVFDRIFQFNTNLEPNSSIYLIIWGLSQLVPMLTAEKLFVSGYWLLFAGSAYYLMRSFGRQAGVYGLLLLPFALGYFLHWGFYNFVLSQALFLLACGYALRHLDHLTVRSLLVLCLLSTLLAVTHLVGIAMFLLFLGLYRTGLALRDTLASRGEWRPVLVRFVRDAALLLLAALPAIAIVVSFLIRRVLADDGVAPVLGFVQKILYIGSVSPVLAVDKKEGIALAAFILLIWALSLRLLLGLIKDRELRASSLPALLPVAVLGGFVLVGSLGFAGFEGLPRLLPFIFFMLIIAFGVLRLSAPWRLAIIVAVVAGIAGTALIRLPFYRQANELYAAFAASRPAPPAGSAIVAFNTTLQEREVAGHSTGWRMNVTDHFRTGYSREKGLLMVNLVHLEPRIYGYFPIAYRPEAMLAAAYSARPYTPPPAPLDHFERTLGMEVAEVSFWPLLESEPIVDFNLEEREPMLRHELAREWRLAPRSSPVAPFVYIEREARPATSIVNQR